MTPPARPYLRADGHGIRLTVHVQPRASRTEIAGVHGDALKIRLAAPPVDGAANEALTDFVAGILAVPRRSVRVVSGATSRRKVLEIAGITYEDAAARLGS